MQGPNPGFPDCLNRGGEGGEHLMRALNRVLDAPFARPFIAAAVRLLRSPKWVFVVARIFLVCAVPIFIFLYHDPNRHYLWTPDADIQFVYEAMRINSGLASSLAAYVGYGLIFLFAEWFQLLNVFGLVDVIDIGSLPPAPAADAVFQQLTYWARVLELMLACVLVVALMFLAQTITGSRFYGFLAALAFSGTQSVNTQVLQIKAELPSTAFAFLAILSVLLAVKWGRDRPRSLFAVALGAFCALFSLYSKTSSLPLVLVLPMFPLFFSSAFAPADDGGSMSPGPGIVLALVAFSGVAGYFALVPFVATMTTAAFFYNGAIVLYVAACMAIFCALRGLSKWDMAAGAAAVILGLAAAQTLLLGFDPHSQSASIANHVGYLSGMIESGSQTNLEEEIGVMALIAKIAQKLSGNFWLILTESYFNFCWVCRRPSIVYLLSLITLAVVLWKVKPDVRLRAVFLILTLVFTEAVLRLHTFSNYYRAYVEGLLFATTVYFIVLIARTSSIAVKRRLAVASLVFVAWFWIDDVNRKMLWPTYVPHVGSVCWPADFFPLVMDRFETHCKIETELNRKIKAGTVPHDTPPPWWIDNRTFIWTKEPWRRWDD